MRHPYSRHYRLGHARQSSARTTRVNFIDRHPTLSTFAAVESAILGAGLLGLPIALAYFTPMTAAVIVVAFGLFNTVTIVAVAQAVSRSRVAASGRGGLAAMASEQMGRRPSQLVGAITVLGALGMVIVYGYGIVTTLASYVGAAEIVWTLLLSVVMLVMVGTKRRDLLVRASTAIVVANLALLTAALCILAITITHQSHASLTTLDWSTFGNHAALQDIMGVAFFVFFGHTTVLVVGPRVIQADPSGRALVRGSGRAMLVATVVNALWVMLALAVVPTERLLDESSTGIGLYAQYCGPAIGVIGLMFVLLAFGFGALNQGFYLSDVARQALPRLASLSLHFTPGDVVQLSDGEGATTVSISRPVGMGNELVVHARRGRMFARETVSGGTWNGSSLLREVEAGSQWFVALTVHGDDSGDPIVTVTTSMHLVSASAEPAWTKLLDTDGTPGRVVAALTREPATLAQLAARLDLTESELDAAVAGLVAEGSVRNEGSLLYPILGRRRVSTIVEATGLAPASPPEVRHHLRLTGLRRRLVDGPMRLFVTLLPVILGLLIIAALTVTDVSFTQALDLIGVLDVILSGAILPLILALILRRRAERAVRPIPVLGAPAFLWACFCGLLILLAGAAYIIDDPVQTIILIVNLAIGIVLVVTAKRMGALTPRSALALEVREDNAIEVAAVKAGDPVKALAPATMLDKGGHVSIEVPGGLTSTFLLFAAAGDALPAQLSQWTAEAGGESATGMLENLSGVSVTLPSAPLRVDFPVS